VIKKIPEKHSAWKTTEKFKLLGIHFNLYKEDTTLENFGEQIKKVNNILIAYRDLAYIGRITVSRNF
jgi:hypothetical protein